MGIFESLKYNEIPHLNHLSPFSDLDRISPYTINDIKKTSNENKEKYVLGDYWLIQSQILQTNVTQCMADSRENY